MAIKIRITAKNIWPRGHSQNLFNCKKYLALWPQLKPVQLQKISGPVAAVKICSTAKNIWPRGRSQNLFNCKKYLASWPQSKPVQLHKYLASWPQSKPVQLQKISCLVAFHTLYSDIPSYFLVHTYKYLSEMNLIPKSDLQTSFLHEFVG